MGKNGAPPLLPHELNKEAHVKAAQLFTHPFDESPQPPDDMAFAWKAAIHQEDFIARREHPTQRFLKLAVDCGELDGICRSRMHQDVRSIAGNLIRPATMLVLPKLLRWPDWSLADNFVEGF